MASHVSYSLQMLCELPQYTATDTYPAVVQNACLESYFVHLRLAVEFFWHDKEKRGRDIHATDFVSDWQADNDRMHELWEFASQNVVHLSMQRIPSRNESVQNVAPRVLSLHAATVIGISKEFRDQLVATGSDVATLFTNTIAAAEKALAS